MTDTWSVTWTVLPNGFGDSGRARLSLVPTLRVFTSTGVLGDSPVAVWPTLIAGLRRLQLTSSTSSAPIEATVVSEPPRQELWNALFGLETAVDIEEPAPEPPMFASVATALHYRAVADSVRTLYAGVDEQGRMPRTDPALDVVRGLAQWSATPTGARVKALPASAQRALDALLEPTALTAQRLADAAALLRAEGQTAAAAALPLALVQQRLQWSGAQIGAPPKPSTLSGIKSVDQADFHQLTTLLRDHPVVAEALGLLVDVEIEPFDGARLLRVRSTGQSPIDGMTPVTHPWSSVICRPQQRRFVMAPDPDGTGEIRQGQLDLSANGRYEFTTADLYAATNQLQALSNVLDDPDAPDEVALPPQRNTGLVLAQVDRKVDSFDRAIDRAKTLSVPAGERVLFADDVTMGYRVDIASDARPFRSLMRRTVTYSIKQSGTRAPLTLPGRDEGLVEGMALAEQYDATGTPHLLLGEEIFGWDGGSLVAPAPGRRVAGEPGGPAVEDQPKQLIPGQRLSLDVAGEPGTLPRLRFGRVYRAQVRAVDLAGNSIAPDGGDPALASPGVPYLRLDPVLTPALAPTGPFTFGESRNRLVVRSNGDGVPVGAPCRRHLFPPKATQRLAETHGVFDAAFGPRATAADRARALAIAVNEQGSLTDPAVPDPADPARKVAQPGVRVVTNVGAPPAQSTLPLAADAQLRAGEYVAFDSDAPLTPYLADPAAAGAAVIGAPGRTEPAIALFGGARWPDARPGQLIARAGTAGATTIKLGADGRGLVEVTVPPAAELSVRVSSALRADRLDAFGVPAGKPRITAANGLNAALSPAEGVVLVHAVSKPLGPLTVDTASGLGRTKGSTVVPLDGALTCHGPSTVRVDLEARWDEIYDDTTSPTVRTEKRTATATPLTIAASTTKTPWKSTLAFGDTLRRDIELVPIGASRYREYFTPQQLEPRVGTGRKVIVPNAGRPPQLRIHSVFPTFRWTREDRPDGSYFSERHTAGVRVYLERPWLTTGVGEQLGVVTFVSAAAGTAAENTRTWDAVTRWAGDPLAGAVPSGAGALDATLVANPATPPRQVRLQEPGLGPEADNIRVTGVEVRFDAERRLWYADVDLKLFAQPNPFIRLALVRYQPESLVDCHVSRVVLTEPIPLPPGRKVHVLPTTDGVSLRVIVKGQRRPDCVYAAELSARVDGTDGAVVQDWRPPWPTRTILPPAGGGDDLADGKFVFGGLPTEHDLVIREELRGDYLHKDQLVPQTTWLEVIDGTRLTRMLGA